MKNVIIKKRYYKKSMRGALISRIFDPIEMNKYNVYIV